ncbi:hypothetical protein D9M73_214880 [compost metagenome]
MRGAGGEHAQRAIAAQSWWPHLQPRLVFQRLMEEEDQPDMADLLQPFDGFRLVERRQQLQHAAGGRGQLRLARDGELLLEAGTQVTDGADAVGHGGSLAQAGERR